MSVRMSEGDIFCIACTGRGGGIEERVERSDISSLSRLRFLRMGINMAIPIISSTCAGHIKSKSQSVRFSVRFRYKSFD